MDVDERPTGASAAPLAPAPPRAADAPDERFALRPEDFRVLASDSRVAILKALDERQMTGTELAKKLGLEKSTVAQHLDRLVEAGLVQRKEDDRLWVYYTLAPRGRRLLHPPRAGFTLLLSGSLLSAGASLTLFGTFLLGNLAREVGRSSPSSAPMGDADDAADAPAAGGSTEPGAPVSEAADGADTAASVGGGVPLLPVLAFGSFALAALLGGVAWFLRPGRGPTR